MPFARSAGRAFARVAPKSWRNAVHNSKWGRSPEEPKFTGDNHANFRVGRNVRDQHGRSTREEYDLIVTNKGDSADIHMARYSKGENRTKYKYVETIGTNLTHVGIADPTSGHQTSTYKASGGTYTGVNAVVKHLQTQGFDVRALNRKGVASGTPTKGGKLQTGTSQFFGQHIDPVTRVGTANVENRYENYMRLNPVSEQQKHWRSQKSHNSSGVYIPPGPKGLPKPGGKSQTDSKDPRPKDPVDPTDFGNSDFDDLFDLKKRFRYPTEDKKTRGKPGQTFGPDQSQNQEKQEQKPRKEWRNPTVKQKQSSQLTGTVEPDYTDVEFVNEKQQANVIEARSTSKQLGMEPRSSSREWRANIKKPGMTETGSAIKNPTVPEKAETRQIETAPQALSLENRPTPRKVAYPNKNTIQRAMDADLPMALKDENADQDYPLTDLEKQALQARIQSAKDTTRMRAGISPSTTNPDEYENSLKYKPGIGDARIQGAAVIHSVFSEAAKEEKSRYFQDKLQGLARIASAQGVPLEDQRKMLDEGQKKWLAANSPKEEKKIRLQVKEDVDDTLQAYQNYLDQQGIGQASAQQSKLLGRKAYQFYPHSMPTGATQEDIAAFDKATAQNNKNLANTRGVGLRSFDVPSPYEDVNANPLERLNQIPQDHQSDYKQESFLQGKEKLSPKTDYTFSPDTPLNDEEINRLLQVRPSARHVYADQIARRLSGLHGLALTNAKLAQDFDVSKPGDALMSGADASEGISGKAQYTGDKTAKERLFAAEQDVYGKRDEMYRKIYQDMYDAFPDKYQWGSEKIDKKKAKLLRYVIESDLSDELAGHVARSSNVELDTHGYNIFTSGIKKDLVDHDLIHGLSGADLAAIDSVLKGQLGDRATEKFALLQNEFDQKLNAQAAAHHLSALENDPENPVLQNMAATSANNQLNFGSGPPESTSLPFYKAEPISLLPPGQQESVPPSPGQLSAPAATADEIAEAAVDGVNATATDATAKLSRGLRRSSRPAQSQPVAETAADVARNLVEEHDIAYPKAQPEPETEIPVDEQVGSYFNETQGPAEDQGQEGWTDADYIANGYEFSDFLNEWVKYDNSAISPVQNNDASARSTSSASQKNNSFALNTDEISASPILDYIINVGGKIKSKSSVSDAGGEYDDMPNIPGWNHRIYSQNGGYSPDEMASILHSQGLLEDPYPATLANALHKEIGNYGQVREMLAEQYESAKQESDFNDLVVNPAVKKGKSQINVDQLSKGDELTVHGNEDLKVVDIDEDGNVILEDGTKFGTIKIPQGQKLWVKSRKSTAATQSQGDDDTPF